MTVNHRVGGSSPSCGAKVFKVVRESLANNQGFFMAAKTREVFFGSLALETKSFL